MIAGVVGRHTWRGRASDGLARWDAGPTGASDPRSDGEHEPWQRREQQHDDQRQAPRHQPLTERGGRRATPRAERHHRRVVALGRGGEAAVVYRDDARGRFRIRILAAIRIEVAVAQRRQRDAPRLRGRENPVEFLVPTDERTARIHAHALRARHRGRPGDFEHGTRQQLHIGGAVNPHGEHQRITYPCR